MLYRVTAPGFTHAPPELCVSQELRQMLVPFFLSPPHEMRPVSLGDIVTSSHRTDNKRNSDGHILNRLKARLPNRPVILNDRVNPNVERLKISNLPLQLPSQVFNLHAGNGNVISSGSDQSQTKPIIARESLKHGKDCFHIRKSRVRADPANNGHIPPQALSQRSKARRINHRGNHDSLPSLARHISRDLTIATLNEARPANQIVSL